MAHHEYHRQNHSGSLNRLRAAVLGANDGIVSIASLVVGVAGATNERKPILIAGMAGLLAGALSMAAGEYVSVSSQRDTERALLKKEYDEIKNYPKEELMELKSIYIAKGLTASTADKVARELSARDAYAAHIDAELGVDPNDLVNPWQAATASALSFLAGAILPMMAIMIPPRSSRVIITFISMVVALAITGYFSAKAGGAPVIRAVVRVTSGGLLAMVVTYVIGRILGATGI